MPPGHKLQPWGMEGGSVALQSLLTMKKGTSPFNSQSNELFSKFLRQQMVIQKLLSDAFREKTRCMGGFHPPITLNLKKSSNFFFSNPMSPLRSFNDKPFYINLICPQGVQLTTLALRAVGGGGGRHLQIHNFRTYQLCWTKWLFQNFDWMCLGKWWSWEGISCPPINPSIRSALVKKKPKKINNTLCPHFSLLRLHCFVAYDNYLVTEVDKYNKIKWNRLHLAVS